MALKSHSYPILVSSEVSFKHEIDNYSLTIETEMSELGTASKK